MEMKNIAVIREYEKLVNDAQLINYMPITQVIENKIVLTGYGEFLNKENKLKEVAEKYDRHLEFSYKVDEIAQGNYSKDYKVKVCETPSWLEELGYNNLPVYYSSWHIFNAIQEKNIENHTHGININKIKTLPLLLEKRPAVALDNIARKDSMICVLEQVDDENIPLIMSIKPNGSVTNITSLEIEEIETNNILTIFGPEHFDEYIKNNFGKEDYIFIGDSSVAKIQEKTGYNVVPIGIDLPKNIIIKTPRCIEYLNIPK